MVVSKITTKSDSDITKADHLHNSAHDEEFEYDGAYRFTKYIKDPDGTPANQQWTLDGVYNWDQFVDYGTTESRTHNSVNEVTAIDTNNDADMLYDSNGNLTKWTDDPEGTPVVKEFLWDDLNRLTKIIVDSNDEAIFIYDVNNQRVRKEYDSDDDGDIDGNDETIEFVWSDGHVIEEYVDGSLDRNYVHGNQFIDELVLFEDSSGDCHYYLQDFRYTVYALVDDTGTVEERYRFDPYGKRTVVTDDGSIDEHYGFTGRYHDDSDDTDLIYFRNRWMSGEMGRFVNRDPLEYADGMNLYAGWFVPGNVDPLGLLPPDMPDDPYYGDPNGRVSRSNFECESCCLEITKSTLSTLHRQKQTDPYYLGRKFSRGTIALCKDFFKLESTVVKVSHKDEECDNKKCCRIAAWFGYLTKNQSRGVFKAGSGKPVSVEGLDPIKKESKGMAMPFRNKPPGAWYPPSGLRIYPVVEGINRLYSQTHYSWPEIIRQRVKKWARYNYKDFIKGKIYNVSVPWTVVIIDICQGNNIKSKKTGILKLKYNVHLDTLILSF